MTDPVNPPHYRKGPYSPIRIMEEYYGISPHLANAMKYILRCDHKANREEDVRKAMKYLRLAHAYLARELGQKKTSEHIECLEVIPTDSQVATGD